MRPVELAEVGVVASGAPAVEAALGEVLLGAADVLEDVLELVLDVMLLDVVTNALDELVEVAGV